ncbi:MAG TPA: hypothetical protein VFQ35_20195 [Polyangiaceae bacterium]|nr:hypothetical protein [Polyangiaceae bacterium]
MLALDLRKRRDGSFQCVTEARYSTLALWLEYDLGLSGGGGMEEFFAELRELREGRRERATTGGDLVYVIVDGDGARLRRTHSKTDCAVSTDELVDAVLRWFRVTNPELADELCALIGVDPPVNVDRKLLEPVIWGPGPSAEFPYRALRGGATWSVRLNDFPAEPMYTLLVDAEEIESFNEWPSHWGRPSEAHTFGE